MRTLQELSAITCYNVIDAFFHDEKCYHLLIHTTLGYYTSYYVEGQKVGITLIGACSSNSNLPCKTKPEFKSNIK